MNSMLKVSSRKRKSAIIMMSSRGFCCFLKAALFKAGQAPCSKEEETTLQVFARLKKKKKRQQKNHNEHFVRTCLLKEVRKGTHCSPVDLPFVLSSSPFPVDVRTKDGCPSPLPHPPLQLPPNGENGRREYWRRSERQNQWTTG